MGSGAVVEEATYSGIPGAVEEAAYSKGHGHKHLTESAGVSLHKGGQFPGGVPRLVPDFTTPEKERDCAQVHGSPRALLPEPSAVNPSTADGRAHKLR